jgi:hypothetical protein
MLTGKDGRQEKLASRGSEGNSISCHHNYSLFSAAHYLVTRSAICPISSSSKIFNCDSCTIAKKESKPPFSQKRIKKSLKIRKLSNLKIKKGSTSR